ncbi:MAG: conjugal transfer protein TraO [Bacteroidota bacterium]
MKKFMIVLAVLPTFLFGQTHLKNQQFIDFSMGGYDGLSTNNYSFNLGLGKYNKKSNTSNFEITYAYKLSETTDIQNIASNFLIPVEQLFISYKRDLSIFRNYNSTFLISIFGKANLGYEAIDRNKNANQDYVLANKSDYLLGVGFGPNIEFQNLHFGVVNNLNFISNYQKFSVSPYLKYRFHL